MTDTLHAAIRAELGPGTRVAEIAARTGRSSKAASLAMNRLLERGLVTAGGATSARRYSPVGGGNSPGSLKPKPLPSLAEARAANQRADRGPNTMSQIRAMVIDAITRDPSALTEDRLAQALKLDRENIADACGQLLLDDQVALNEDGTYRPITAKREREREQDRGLAA